MAITSPTIEARRSQMFPALDACDVGRLKRFGTARRRPAGGAITRAGEASPGLGMVLC